MGRFPAAEPEPPPPSAARHLARAAAVLGLFGLVALALVEGPDLLRPGPDPHGAVRAAASPPASGRVLVVDGNHLSVADPSGKVVSTLTDDLPIEPVAVSLVADPTGTRAVIGPGRGFGSANLLVPLRAPAAAKPAAPPDLLAGGGLAEQPWADQGRAVVLVRGADGDQVALVDTDTGAIGQLGRGVSAVGDPVTRGAAMATGGHRLPDVEGQAMGATAARIELHQAGRPARVLAATADLARLAGLPAGEELVVERLAFSPRGTRLLVALDTAATREFPRGFNNPPRRAPAGAVVVLDREGRVVATRRSTPRTAQGWVRWSGEGHVALGEAVETDVLGYPDLVLGIWDLRSPPVRVPLPGAFQNALAQPCAWAPSMLHLLCGDDRGWYDVDAAARSARLVRPVTGRPLLWLAS